MLNKNDPLIGAVQEVMKRNQAEREAAKLVNEKFGIHDRKALPHERQGEWDAAYKTVLTEGVEALDEVLDTDEKKMKYAKKASDQIKAHAERGGAYDMSSKGEKEANKIERRTKGLQRLLRKMQKEEALDEAKIDHPNKRKLDVAEPYGELTSDDFRKLRAMKEEEQIDEAGMIPAKGSVKRAILTGKAKLKRAMIKRGADQMHDITGHADQAAYAKSRKLGKIIDRLQKEETLEEREMTSLEKTKEEKLKAKLDTSGMKASMQKQYGKEEGKKIYFATIRKKAMKEDNEGFNGRHGLSVTASAVKQVVAEQARARSDYGLGAIPAQKNAAQRRAELDARMEKGIDTVAPFIPGVGAARAIDKYARGQQGLGQTAADVGLNLAGGALVTGAGKLARMGYNALRGARTAKNLANPAARGAATAADKSAGAVPAAAAKKADDGAKAATSLTSRPTLPAATAADKSAGAVPAAAAKKADDVVSVGDKFRVNAANRRYSPAGAEAKPPTAPPKQPTTQSGVPAIVSKKGPGRSNVERVGPFNPIGPKAPARPTTPNAAAGNAARVAARQRLAAASKDKVLKGAAATGLGVGALKVAQNQYSATSPATAQNTTAGTPAAPKPAASTAQAPVPKARPVTAPAAPAAQAPKPAAVAQQRPAAPVAAQPSAAERRENRRLLDRGQVVGQQAIAAQQRSGTGVTIQQKAAPQVKRPVGTGREK